MYLEGKRLFIAGDTGIAGSAVLRHVLAVAGDVRVRVSHRGATGAFINDARVEYVAGDLTGRRIARAWPLDVIARCWRSAGRAAPARPRSVPGSK